ncbi:Gfo/Idh/MocA family protein [Agrobacterium rosae]|uniref:Gfo/Idh/MocA family oxidoreductase n=1 Tax=Agrobacterium rosae TaxID=1972867 RepID=A0A1R3TNX1_9HYPH|nr:Gfo/Idh/MocA family oxidoreductase [Agrobacterium rosae]KAA3511679.1 gfo/Idh/MocA family oxidoreductase [Agrobacterium rosae]KAA3518900.1 gfo/Idh/MocA family oxidoreductase [Agrobacterium rosae]MBN7806719.1 Gfo/Idh/MocA family oxidoreductase [Agrobacterium rosae]MCM2435137.1 Gfo/Idh/MocA family oxidoreductase [Agrobacterium rosae]MDX8304107.1 Gfo/Idh/MocA family oxidoreductase [Agrobacterium rosae]
MTKRYKVGIIGCGIGRSHISEGYAMHPDKYEVAVLCDLDAVRLNAVADEFSVPCRITSSDELMEMPDIDIIDICTPPAIHTKLILQALAAGKHVVCEKPLTGSLAELDEVVSAEQTAKGMLMPIYQYRYGDGVQQARRIIESGLAGKPYVATAETLWKRDAAYYDNPWRGRWATELGGVLMTHAIHLHDMMTYLMGPIDRVFARAATRVNSIEVEDCVSASLLMKNGALVSLTATLGSQEEISRLRLAFENVTFESNHAAYSPGDGPWRIIPANEEIGNKIDALLSDMPTVGRRFNGQMEAFYHTLEKGEKPPVTTSDARGSLELVAAIYHSNDINADVALPITKGHPKYISWRP